jgi:hypothetical protein
MSKLEYTEQEYIRVQDVKVYLRNLLCCMGCIENDLKKYFPNNALENVKIMKSTLKAYLKGWLRK